MKTYLIVLIQIVVTVTVLLIAPQLVSDANWVSVTLGFLMLVGLPAFLWKSVGWYR